MSKEMMELLIDWLPQMILSFFVVAGLSKSALTEKAAREKANREAVEKVVQDNNELSAKVEALEAEIKVLKPKAGQAQLLELQNNTLKAELEEMYREQSEVSGSSDFS